MAEGWLKGWQGIADYMNVSIRTAKNYHYKYSMPIHPGPGGSVYTIPYEIDQWLIVFSKKVAKEKGLNPGWIYFIQAEDREIKIGWSQKGAQFRMKNIQTYCPLKLTLLVQIPGSLFYEAKLHKKFKAHKKIGEWFYPSKPILTFIEKHKEK